METKEKIKNLINDNDVCLFMKGTKDSPQCGFSMAVSNVLKHLNVNFKGINILEDESLRQGIKEYSDWPTIPQLYVKKEFIGGCDIVKEMFEKGELKKLFEDKKIIWCGIISIKFPPNRDDEVILAEESSGTFILSFKLTMTFAL